MRTRSTVAAAIALAACGRLGFEEREPQQQVPVVDAATGDVLASPGDGLAICGQAAPFLRFLDAVHDGSSPGHYTVSFCYSGLPGPVTASIRRSGDASVVVESTGPIDAGAPDLNLGGADCPVCFARVEANGFVDDGPVRFFTGD